MRGQNRRFGGSIGDYFESKIETVLIRGVFTPGVLKCF